MKKLIGLIFLVASGALAQCPAAMSTLTTSTNLSGSVDSKVCGLKGSGAPTASWCTTALVGLATYINTANGDIYDCTANLTWTKRTSGGGTGDVSGPATNTDLFIPQWNGANSKLLKNGIDPATLPTLAGTNTFTGTMNLGGATRTAPMKVGTSLPGTCTVGDLYFKSDATAGQNIYQCQSTNTWTQQLNSGGSSTTGVIVYKTSNWTNTSGAWTPVSWDTIDSDTSSGALWAVGNPTKLVATSSGRYKLECNIYSDTTFGATVAIRVKVNGTDIYPGTQIYINGPNLAGFTSIFTVRTLNLSNTDYAECEYFASNAVTMQGGKFNSHAAFNKEPW